MTPTVVLKSGRPVLAIGGRGGRRIPNAVYSALLDGVPAGRPIEESVDAPRLHTEGGMAKAFRVPERWRLQMTAVARILFLVAAQTLLPIEVGRWSVPGRNEFSSVGSGSGALMA